MIYCKYRELTPKKWIKNANCRAWRCKNPDAPFGITGVVRFHCRFSKDGQFEVRSTYCNARYCDNFTPAVDGILSHAKAQRHEEKKEEQK